MPNGLELICDGRLLPHYFNEFKPTPTKILHTTV
jgi:hypothetical protein